MLEINIPVKAHDWSQCMNKNNNINEINLFFFLYLIHFVSIIAFREIQNDLYNCANRWSVDVNLYMIFGTEVIICGISKHAWWYIGNISHWIICRKSILHVIDIAMIQCFSSYGIYCSWFSNMIYLYDKTFEISMYCSFQIWLIIHIIVPTILDL